MFNVICNMQTGAMRKISFNDRKQADNKLAELMFNDEVKDFYVVDNSKKIIKK